MFVALSQSPLFKGLSSYELENIFLEISYSTKSYRKGQAIAQRDEVINHLLVVIEGTAKGEMVDLSGRILKVEEIPTSQPMAHAVLFSKNNRFPVNAVALTDCKILFIPRADVLWLMQSNEVFLNNFLLAVSNRAHFLTTKLWFLSFKTIKEKVAHYLLSLAKSETKTTIILPKSHQELAELFGVTRPSLARAFAEMKNEGIIEVDKREVRIVNKEKLMGLVQ